MMTSFVGIFLILLVSLTLENAAAGDLARPKEQSLRHVDRDPPADLFAKASALVQRVAHSPQRRFLELDLTCHHLESIFDGKVDCQTDPHPLWNLTQGGSFQFSCQYRQPVCRDLFCVRPSYNGTLTALASQGQYSYRSTLCTHDMHSAVSQYQDLCVTAEFCLDIDARQPLLDSSVGLCDCQVTYGGQMCNSCRPCGPGQAGVKFNCTNLNPEVIVEECTNVRFPLLQFVDTVRDKIPAFIPTFNGSCTYLETLTDGAMVCDCVDWQAFDATIKCWTPQPVCAGPSYRPNVFAPWREGGNCINTTSSVKINDLKIESVASCTRYQSYDGQVDTLICSDFEFCQEERPWGTVHQLCDAHVSIDGQTCQVESCPHNRSGVVIKCTFSATSYLALSACLDLRPETVLNFAPQFMALAKMTWDGNLTSSHDEDEDDDHNQSSSSHDVSDPPTNVSAQDTSQAGENALTAASTSSSVMKKSSRALMVGAMIVLTVWL